MSRSHQTRPGDTASESFPIHIGNGKDSLSVPSLSGNDYGKDSGKTRERLEEKRLAASCPGCGSDSILPGRIYCKPSCRARAQWRAAQGKPRPLFDFEPESEGL